MNASSNAISDNNGTFKKTNAMDAQEFMEVLPPDNSNTSTSSHGPSPTAYHSINFKNSEHVTSAFATMNNMRRSGQLCDIILQVADRQINCHKVVLAATSAYFNAMFNSKYKYTYFYDSRKISSNRFNVFCNNLP